MRWTLFILAAAQASACQPVDGGHILGKHLAAANPIFATLDPDLAIGFAPLAGVQRVLRTPELARIARDHAIPSTDLLAPVCFERVTERMTAEQLQPILRAALEKAAIGNDAIQFEIVDFSRYGIPHGTLEFPESGLASSGMWRGRVSYDEGRSAPVWARIRFTSGQPVPEGTVSRPETARPTLHEVGRGDTVQVEVTSGGARLAFESKAESPGRTGEFVIVRNPENGRLFRAKVEAKGRVSIQK